jgi:hypothetical protein
MSKHSKEAPKQKQVEPAASAWTQDQLHYLSRLAWKEMFQSPGFRSLSRERQTETVTQRLQQMVASDHYWNLALKQFPPTQPTTHDSPTMQSPAHDLGAVHRPSEVSLRQKEESYDPKRLAGMSAAQILEELLKSGLVKDVTEQGRGLEIVHTSHRHEHDYEGS